MDDNLAKDINEAIGKNLPAHIGNHLLTRLKQAEEDAKGLREAKESLEKNKKYTAELGETIERLKKQAKDEADLTTREKTLATGLAKHEVREAILGAREKVQEYYASDCARRVTDLKDVLALVFANNQIKRQVTEQVAKYPEYDERGHYVKGPRGDTPTMEKTADRTETTEG